MDINVPICSVKTVMVNQGPSPSMVLHNIFICNIYVFHIDHCSLLLLCSESKMMVSGNYFCELVVRVSNLNIIRNLYYRLMPHIHVIFKNTQIVFI